MKRKKLTTKTIQSQQTDSYVTIRSKIFNVFNNCQTSCKYEIGRPEFAFKYRINDSDYKRSYGNIIGNNDAILDNVVLQPNFKYYGNHDK